MLRHAIRVSLDAMTVSEVVIALLASIGRKLPKAAEVVAALAPRALSVSDDRPEWASEEHGEDVFLELAGDVHGVAIWNDSRGWGAYAKVYVARGSLEELAAAVAGAGVGPFGPPLPALPDDVSGVTTVASYPTLKGHGVRIFVDHRGGDVKHVTVHFGR